MFTKRFLALVNLKTNRKDAARGERLARLAVRQIMDLQPDHVLLTGDFSNMALASEFELARDVLAPLWDHKRLSVVPGNHDYYTRDSTRIRLFERYFGHLIWGVPPNSSTYPGIKTIAPGVVLLLFRSTHYLPGILSFGWISRDQIDRARAAVNALNPEFAIAAFHHNLHKRGLMVELTGRMLYREQLKQQLLDLGVNLVLTGHDHHHLEYVVSHGNRSMQVIGSGSTTLATKGHIPNFTVLDLDTKHPKKPLQIKVFSYDPAKDEFHEGNG